MVRGIFVGLARVLVGFWNAISLIGLLSIVATIPILQFASLGYMLECSGRIAAGNRIGRCFPGAAIAGKIFACCVWIGLLWLPVWFIADMAYSAELVSPGANSARFLRVTARFVSFLWIAWVVWAVFRGGRWWHFLWPAPLRFVRTIFKPATWKQAEDNLWELVTGLRLWYLLKLGFLGTVGALAWIGLPATMIVIGLSSSGGPGAGLIGLVGAVLMWWVLLHLPFLQVQFARDGRFASLFDLSKIRATFRRAPWAFCISTWLLIALALPLYLLRIEEIPHQLWWTLSIFFVLFMFPPKLITGWALRRAAHRERDVGFVWRWIAWVPQFAVISVYLASIYIAKFALWEGGASIFLQHAFLPPVPFYL